MLHTGEEALTEDEINTISSWERASLGDFFNTDDIVDPDQIFTDLIKKHPELADNDSLAVLQSSMTKALNAFNNLELSINFLPEWFARYANIEPPKRMSIEYDEETSSISVMHKWKEVINYGIVVDDDTNEMLIEEVIDGRPMQYNLAQFNTMMSNELDMNLGVYQSAWEPEELNYLQSSQAIYATASFVDATPEDTPNYQTLSIPNWMSKKLTGAEVSWNNVTIDTLLMPDWPNEVLITNTDVSESHKARLRRQWFGDVVRARKTDAGYVTLSTPESRPWLFQHAIITNLDTRQISIDDPSNVDLSTQTLPVVFDDVDDKTLEECILHNGVVALDYQYTKTPWKWKIQAIYDNRREMFVDNQTHEKIYIWDGIMAEILPEKEIVDNSDLIDDIQGSERSIDDLISLNGKSDAFIEGFNIYKQRLNNWILRIEENSWSWQKVYMSTSNLIYLIDDGWENADYHQALSISLLGIDTTNDQAFDFEEYLAKEVESIIVEEFMFTPVVDWWIDNDQVDHENFSKKTPLPFSWIRTPDDPTWDNYRSRTSWCALCSRAAFHNSKQFGVDVPWLWSARASLDAQPIDTDHYIDDYKCNSPGACNSMSKSAIVDLLEQELDAWWDFVDVWFNSNSRNWQLYGHRAVFFYNYTQQEWYFLDPLFNYWWWRTYKPQPINMLTNTWSLSIDHMRYYNAPVAVV